MCKKLYSTKPLQSHFVLSERKGERRNRKSFPRQQLASRVPLPARSRQVRRRIKRRREREKNFFDGRRLRGVERREISPGPKGRKSSLLIIFGKVHLPALPSTPPPFPFRSPIRQATRKQPSSSVFSPSPPPPFLQAKWVF